MKKFAVVLAAVLLFAFYMFGLFRWFSSGHTIQEVLGTIASDWFLLITFVDLAVFFLLTMVWLVGDMKKRSIRVIQIIGLILGCLLVGVAPLLLYIVYRKNPAL